MRRAAFLSEIDEIGRNAPFYVAAHADLDSIELLAAADAPFNLTDSHHRTVLHYAAMHDLPKLVEAVFLEFKSHGKPL